jgi:peptidoglycan DL-endopeptidase CwlO
MSRFPRTIVAIVGVAVAALTAGAVPHAAADPLGDAKARAATLTKTVNTLTTEAEVATERYDATQSQLNIAVAERGRADQQLSAVQADVSAARTTVDDRARALYEGGGAPIMITSLLAGQNPNDAVTSYQLVGTIIAAQNQQVRKANTTLVNARQLDQHDAVASRQVIKLQTAQQAQSSKIQTLLSAQRQALATANGTVRRIMRADAAAAAAAQAADFANAVSAQGGSINFTGPITAPNTTAAAAISAAHSRLGVPYVWGATGPGAFDCSGLTQWSYAHAGISLPRTAAEQWNAGPHPALADLEPGDLLFWALNTSDPATIHHVAMYIGHGLMIAAPHTGENVQIQPVYLSGFIGAVRPWA